ncbi:MAG: nucleotide exchange factor GrpE [Pseudomonadota bacterium]
MADDSKSHEAASASDGEASAAAEAAGVSEAAEAPAAESAGEAAGASAKLDSFDAEAVTPKPTPPPAVPEPEITPQERIAALEAEVATAKDQHLRAVAEIQNIRRRAERDRREAEQFGGVKLARDLMDVFDNLDDALKLASDTLKENEAGFFNGVELTRKVMLDALAKHQITPMGVEPGAKFDPHKHQAMYEAPAPGAEPGSVIQVMKEGFMIADRLLRPAMVGVASAASAAASAPAGDGETAADA